MTTIYVSDIVAVNAFEWCAANVPNFEWEFKSLWPGQGYHFKFDDAEMATFFSVKWTGNA